VDLAGGAKVTDQYAFDFDALGVVAPPVVVPAPVTDAPPAEPMVARPWPNRTLEGVAEYREIARIVVKGSQPSPALARAYEQLADEIESELSPRFVGDLKNPPFDGELKPPGHSDWTPISPASPTREEVLRVRDEAYARLTQLRAAELGQAHALSHCACDWLRQRNDNPEMRTAGQRIFTDGPEAAIALGDLARAQRALWDMRGASRG
jgi:hypothetical protein